MLPALLAGLWVQPSRRHPAALRGILAEAAAHLAVVGALYIIQLSSKYVYTCGIHTHACMYICAALFVTENFVCGVGWSRWGFAGEPPQLQP